MVLKINANLMENKFQIKEINAKEGVTFQIEGNWCAVYEETKLVETQDQS